MCLKYKLDTSAVSRYRLHWYRRVVRKPLHSQVRSHAEMVEEKVTKDKNVTLDTLRIPVYIPKIPKRECSTYTIYTIHVHIIHWIKFEGEL